MSLNEIRNFDDAILLCRDMAKTRASYKDVMGFALDMPETEGIGEASAGLDAGIKCQKQLFNCSGTSPRPFAGAAKVYRSIRR